MISKWNLWVELKTGISAHGKGKYGNEAAAISMFFQAGAPLHSLFFVCRLWYTGRASTTYSNLATSLLLAADMLLLADDLLGLSHGKRNLKVV
jgi:hypothetical protein